MQRQFALLVMGAILVASPRIRGSQPAGPPAATTPAFQLSASAGLIARLGNRPVDQVSPVSLALDEGLAIGVFRLTGWMQVVPVPCGDRAALELTTFGQSVGTARALSTVCSKSTW